ncbi:hypothetical protein F0562_032402 [Nyssa sinensis]|uniref:Uncharacterized protein n=1 Tax=Nyssa sinensis TaxID=561372 RepID=A0A5J5AMW3_9ASTE|nr:hypothetical protein F0562_032402 [Nyssa sinensis]
MIEMHKLAYNFLHRVALYYYELKDNVAMMKFVKSFHTIELTRTFLNNLDCIDELFSLEKERGNFLEAANIAKKKGDILLEADVVEKAGLFREASMLILWYVFSNPLEQLKQKDELLTKAKSIAKNHSDHFYEFVCEEVDILSKERANEKVLDTILMKFFQYWKQNAPIDVGRVKRSYEINIIEKKMLKEAVKIAEQKGDLLCMADLLGKAGDFKEASIVLLWYCFASSLWVSRSKGWPLKQFKRKEKILTKAKSCAKSDSDLFYEFVCMEANILSNSKTSLSEMKQNMIASQRHKSLREDLISQNRVTMETLIYFWDFWKEKIVNLIDSLWCIGKQNVSEYMTYENFCLNYMGVQKHDVNKNTIYLFLYSNANWLREIGYGLTKRNGNLVSFDAQQFVPAIRRYWCSEIHFVGLKVLKTLEALYDYSVKNSFSMFHQTMSVVHIFEVATFLQKYNFVDRSGPVREYIDLSCNYFFGNIFPLDWRKSLMQNMIFLRGTEQSMNILNQVIFTNISTESPLTYGQMSRVVVMILGSGGLTDELYKKILESFIANSEWREFVGELSMNRGSATNNSCYSSTEVSLGFHYDSRQEVSLVCKFSEALKNASFANWEAEHDFISPSCFLYLVERLILLLSYFHGYFLTTKSSFVEWLIFQEWSINPSSISINDTKLSLILGDIYNFLACVVQELLLKELLLKIHGAMVVLRLVVVLCLICVNSGKHFDKLFNMLGRSDIVSQLPRAFCDALRRAQKCNFIYVLADALGKIENPFILVNLRNNFSRFSCSNAIFVSMKVSRCREDILQALFLEKGVATNSFSNDDHDQEKGSKFWEILDGLELLETGKGGDAMHLVSIIPIIKEEVDEKFQLISFAMASFQANNHQDEGKILLEANSMLDALNQLSSALDIRVRITSLGLHDFLFLNVAH